MKQKFKKCFKVMITISFCLCLFCLHYSLCFRLDLNKISAPIKEINSFSWQSVEENNNGKKNNSNQPKKSDANINVTNSENNNSDNNTNLNNAINTSLNYQSKKTEITYNIIFNNDDKILDFNLVIRENAKKYITENDKINENKLSAFLEECNRRNIMAEYALEFCFENFKEVIDNLVTNIDKKAENAMLTTVKNSGKAIVKSAKNGVQIDKNNLIFDIFYNLVNFNNKIKVKTIEVKPIISTEFIENCSSLRGKFYTTYSSSTADRKHNIELALSKFDGLVIMPNEVLSFNATTGVRNEANGYKGAKIIVAGKFEDGIGGGVCQASTTIYNACILAGLDIEEVNQHSLKVGYVAPSYDAMVNYGSSDLKIRNSTNYPIMLATKCDGNTCEVFVYGEKNPYKIVRRSETIKEIEPKADKIINIDDYDGTITVADGQEVYTHYPKKGLISVGYLDYYQGDCLIATKQIRKNTYGATQGVKIVGRPLQ